MSGTSVVVVSFASAGDLAACLASVRRQGEDVEVVVVDNGSRDGSLLAAARACPGARLFALGENRGFAAAASLGMRAARGDLVVLLNPDATLEAGALAALQTAAVRRPEAGLFATKVLSEDGRVEAVGHLLAASGLNGGRGAGEPDDGRRDLERDVAMPSGAAMALRRAVVAEVGGFDPRWFAYGEEADLALRSTRAGWRTLAVPGAVARHRGSADTPLKAYLVERNRIWVLAGHLPLARGAADSVVRIVAGVAAAALGRGALGRVGGPALAGAILRAWRDAARGLPGALRRRRLAGDLSAAAALARRHPLPRAWWPA